MTRVRSITELIGGTPLVRLNRISDESGAEVYGKLESFNPGGSVKDRIGLAMVEAAEREGRIGPGRTTIVEPTSGNTGIALAIVAAARGYDVVLCMPETMSIERRKLLLAYGARLEFTPGSDGMQGALARADGRRPARTPSCRSSSRTWPTPRLIVARRPRRSGPTPRARSTSSWRRSGPAAPSRAWGRGSANARRACAWSPSSRPPRRCSAGQPASHPLQGIGAGFVPAVLDTAVYDEVVQVEADDAFAAARRLAVEEGLLVGISAGANVWAAEQVARRSESRGLTVVTILCDTGERYLSTALFDGGDV